MENEIQQNIPPVQPFPQTPAPVLTSSSTNWSQIFLFIILGLIVIAGSVFVGIQIGKRQTSNQQPTPSSQTIINPTNLPTTNPTANWKTYTNKTIGFSLSYPQEYTMTGEDQAGNITLVSPTKNENWLVISIAAAGEFNGNPTDYLKDIEDYLKPTGILSSGYQIKNIKVNGMNVVYLKYYFPEEGEVYYLLREHKRILIDKRPIITSKQHEFDQILSTFKFTN